MYFVCFSKPSVLVFAEFLTGDLGERAERKHKTVTESGVSQTERRRLPTSLHGDIGFGDRGISGMA